MTFPTISLHQLGLLLPFNIYLLALVVYILDLSLPLAFFLLHHVHFVLSLILSTDCSCCTPYLTSQSYLGPASAVRVRSVEPLVEVLANARHTLSWRDLLELYETSTSPLPITTGTILPQRALHKSQFNSSTRASCSDRMHRALVCLAQGRCNRTGPLGRIQTHYNNFEETYRGRRGEDEVTDKEPENNRDQDSSRPGLPVSGEKTQPHLQCLQILPRLSSPTHSIHTSFCLSYTDTHAPHYPKAIHRHFPSLSNAALSLVPGS